MIISVSALLGSSIDMRIALSERSMVTSRLNLAMGYLKKDIQQAYMLSANLDKAFVPLGFPITFFISTLGGENVISFSSMNRDINSTNENISELSKVTYKIQQSKDFPSRNALYRGSLSLHYEGDPELILLVEGIRSFSVEMWNGSEWDKEWDTNKSAFKQSIPRMVKVSVNAYLNDPDQDQDQPQDFFSSDEIDQIGHRTTIVYIPWSKRFPELKDKVKTVKW